MYRALYRKWRPARFEDVVGQKSIVTALQNQILHDKVGHAYLFTGTRGTGKTTCAKIFAKAVNCENPQNGDPCGKCALCTGIDNGSVLDVVELDAATYTGVDNIRELRDETAYTPSQGRYKVYIIDEVHMLSASSFNALLKIMEEPPSHVIFILATTEVHKVPATVLSRCQRYDFTRIAPADIAGRLAYVAEQESIALTPEAAALIARLADGAMRDALSILDTCAGVSDTVDEALVRRMAGVTDRSYLFELTDALTRRDAAAALALIAQLREKSVDTKRLCDELILHYRNLLLAGVPGAQGLLSGASPEEEQRYLETARTLPKGEALRAVKTFCEALDRMGKNTDARIELELALFTLCQPPAGGAQMAAGPAGAAAAPFAAPAAYPAPAASAYAAPPAAPNRAAPSAVPAPAYAAPAAASAAAGPAAAPAPARTAAPAHVSGAQSAPPVPELPFTPDAPAAPQTRASAVRPLSVQEDAQPSEEPSFDDEPAMKNFRGPEPPPRPQDEPDESDEPDEPAAGASGGFEASPQVPDAAQRGAAPPSAGAAPMPAAPAAPAASHAAAAASPAESAAAAPADPSEIRPFAEWPAVVQAMEKKDPMLFTYMSSSKAYLQGKRVLIDGSDLFLEYIRKYQDLSGKIIKETVAEVTGLRCSIGPYKKVRKQQTSAAVSGTETLARLEQKGVPIVYEDEEK